MFGRNEKDIPSPILEVARQPEKISTREPQLVSIYTDHQETVPDYLITGTASLTDAAKRAPEEATDCVDLFKTLLGVSHKKVTSYTYDAIHSLTAHTTDLATELFDQILGSLGERVATDDTARAKAIAAIGHTFVIEDSDHQPPIEEYDPLFARLIEQADKPVLLEVAKTIGTIAVENPTGFPRTISSLPRLLKSPHPDVRMETGRSLALLADTNPAATDDWESIYSQIESFYSDPDIPSSEVYFMLASIEDR